MEFKVKLRDFVGSEVIFPITADSEEEARKIAKEREEVADSALTASSESDPNFVKGDIPGKPKLHDYEIVSIEKVRESQSLRDAVLDNLQDTILSINSSTHFIYFLPVTRLND